MRKTHNLAAIAFCLSALAACGGDSEAARDEHLKRGDQYAAEKKYQEALVEYRAAVQEDRGSGLARQKLAEAYLQTNDIRKAIGEFVGAADLLPNDIPAQLNAGQALLRVSQFEDANARANKVLAIDPGNIDAHILKGNALGRLHQFKEALDEIQEAIRADPTKSIGYAHLAVLQYAQGDLAQAEAAFRRAVATDPKSPEARLAQANFYWATSRLPEAESSIKEAAKLDPTSFIVNQALAELYGRTGRIAEAEGPLKAVAANSKDFRGKILLADYYVNLRRLPEAKALYEEVAAGGEGAPAAKLRLASLGIMGGDRASASRLVSEILAKDPNHVEALVARAQLQFAEGKLADALASARSATAGGPNSALAHYVLGQILRAQNQVEDAESAFKDALRASSGFAPANIELARLSLLAGKNKDAILYAQAAIDRVPGYGEAYLLLARAEIANGNPAAAAPPLKVMASAFPDSPVVQAELGRLLLARSDTAGAAAAYTRALAKDPLQVVALEGMVALEVRQKKLLAARKRLDDAVAAGPNSADLQLMAARLYSGLFGDTAAAEASVKRALDADSANLAAYELLARLYAQANNLPAATAEFEKLVQRQPKSVANHTTLGLLFHLQNKLDQAKASYERALALDARAPMASNNLAQLYLDKNENLDLALQLAQTAKAGWPTSHEVDDTLGWAYYKKGNGPMAVASLKQAVSAQPENAVYLYHLGAAYALNNDKANARQALENALKLQANFPGADDARRILDSMK